MYLPITKSNFSEYVKFAMEEFRDIESLINIMRESLEIKMRAQLFKVEEENRILKDTIDALKIDMKNIDRIKLSVSTRPDSKGRLGDPGASKLPAISNYGLSAEEAKSQGMDALRGVHNKSLAIPDRSEQGSIRNNPMDALSKREGNQAEISRLKTKESQVAAEVLDFRNDDYKKYPALGNLLETYEPNEVPKKAQERLPVKKREEQVGEKLNMIDAVHKSREEVKVRETLIDYDKFEKAVQKNKGSHPLQ